MFLDKDKFLNEKKNEILNIYKESDLNTYLDIIFGKKDWKDLTEKEKEETYKDFKDNKIGEILARAYQMLMDNYPDV